MGSTIGPLAHRYQQHVPVTDIFSTLQSVQINPTEMCNRTCIFCPRHDSALYKNKKEYVSIDVCEMIAKQLAEINYAGRIGFVGFGEPLLHSNIVDCVAAVREGCPSAQWIEINTNGDFLTRDLIIRLRTAGCTEITISMYDRDDTVKFDEMFSGIDIKYILRHHYDSSKVYNLTLVNRSGMLKNESKGLDNKQCYIPFYKLFIDWNGDYLICDQDWGRESKEYNIVDVAIGDFWTDKLNKYRKQLAIGNRQSCAPCHKCDAIGTLYGQESFDYIADRLG
jgi:radical SAM protein with 4Fe4S-binding SPASM domain